MSKSDGIDLENPVKVINVSDLLNDASVEDFLLANGGSQNLRNYEQIASYNWLGTPAEPQLVVPGAPKALTDWRSLRGRRLQRDSCGLIVDENHLMNKEYPMESLFRCLKLQMQDEGDVYETENPLTKDFKFQNFDIVTDRNNLRKLFDIVKQDFAKVNRDVGIRIDVRVLGNLVCLIRCEEADIESGRNFLSYGKDFETKMTKSVNDFSSGSFRQIVAYTLGELNFLVRFEVDAADYAKSHPVPMKKVVKKDANDDEDQDLDVLLNKMNLKTEKPTKIPSSNLSILRSGEKYNYHLVEVTSRRSNADFPRHIWPQMYFSGIESMVIGWQFYGKLEKIERLTIKDVEKEYGGYPTEQMAQFYSLLTKIVKFARQKCDDRKKSLAIIWRQRFGLDLKIHEIENCENLVVPESFGDYIAQN